jgi:hypothetical protein
MGKRRTELRDFVEDNTEIFKASVIGGIALLGIAEVGSRLDVLLNPNLIAVLQEKMLWYQIFTTKHAATVIYLNHEPISAAVVFAIGAATALAAALRN